jgi:predicted ATPase
MPIIASSTRDAAYENLLKSRRQVLHRRVGETLRDKFPSTAAAEPELLAYHFTQYDRSGHRMVGQSRRAVAGTLGAG